MFSLRRLKICFLCCTSCVHVRMQAAEYAIEVVLSDESQYTVYRTIKDIATFHVRNL